MANGAARGAITGTPTADPARPCIYCGAPATSREHWLPRGFGAIRGAELLPNCICHDCNQALGQLDEELARTGPTGFFRTLLGIRGRTGHTAVNPFHYRAGAAVQPTTMLAPCAHGDYQILVEAYYDAQNDRNGTRALRQLVFLKADGTYACVPFPLAYDAARLANAINIRGLNDATFVEGYLDSTEDERALLEFKRVATEACGRELPGRAAIFFGQGEAVLRPTDLALGVNRNYLRAVAKVMFHYFVWTSPSWSGGEPEFEAMRRFVRYDEGDSGLFIDLNGPQFIPSLQEGRGPQEPSHFLFAEVNPTHVLARVQFFVSPDNLPIPPAAVIRLASTSPLRIDARWMVCHWVRYFPERTDGYDGQIERVEVAPRRIIMPGLT